MARVISRAIRVMPGDTTGHGLGLDVVGARQKCR
jgi:hypothetical protein